MLYNICGANEINPEINHENKLKDTTDFCKSLL